MDTPVRIALAIIGLLCVGAMGYWAITYRSEARARAAQFTWMRAQAIQQWQTVEESDWDVPPTGRMLRSYSAVHHYDRYISGSHQVCNGTGSQRSCRTEYDYSSRPVYHTKYDYEIEKWVTVRTPTNQGEGQTPIWPDVSDIRTEHTPPQIGDERAGMRTSRYTIVLQGKDESYSLDITEARWMAFEKDAYYTVVLNIFGQPLDIHEQAATLAVRY